MTEHDTIKNIIKYGFKFKSQLKSQKTVMLQSIISIMIMECEDILAEFEELDDADSTEGSPEPDV